LNEINSHNFLKLKAEKQPSVTLQNQSTVEFIANRTYSINILCTTLTQLHFNHHSIQFYVHNFTKLYILHFIQLYCHFYQKHMLHYLSSNACYAYLKSNFVQGKVEKAESNIIYESSYPLGARIKLLRSRYGSTEFTSLPCTGSSFMNAKI